MNKNSSETTYKSINEIEKKFFPNFYEEKIKKQQAKNDFKDFHMDETDEIEKYLKKVLKKIN